IVITSNREQELPTAFKGRCIYHYIRFPEPATMRNILDKHFTKLEPELLDRSLDLFYQLREFGLERAPSTRELLNWLKYLQTFDPEQALERVNERIGMGVLVKTQKDLAKVIHRLGK
ncbi:MAG: MoxR family ATPase, partial [Bacteroidota bacterium]